MALIYCLLCNLNSSTCYLQFCRDQKLKNICSNYIDIYTSEIEHTVDTNNCHLFKGVTSSKPSFWVSMLVFRGVSSDDFLPDSCGVFDVAQILISSTKARWNWIVGDCLRTSSGSKKPEGGGSFQGYQCPKKDEMFQRWLPGRKN